MDLSSIFFIIILFYSIILHEVAHGYAAYRNGDRTAFNAGRLTLNPFSHIDFIGSIIVPIFSYYTFGFPFGWAKPVPYNPNNVKHNKFAELEIASAGILTNIFLALLSVLTFYLLRGVDLISLSVKDILIASTSINLFLAFFNLLPFPPADGFSIFSELYIHLKSFLSTIFNKFRNKKIYQANYLDRENNAVINVKRLFYNPFMMIAVIFVAVNVFSLLVPYILNLINFLFSF
jgi:Zn-dependent protease